MEPKLVKEGEVLNDLLGYEGLKIIQRPDAFNFSLDSTLLADFVTITKRQQKIIDLGCGNGYIPIFLTLRTNANIIGVELQPDLADLAKRSVEINKLENQITIVNEDIKNLHKLYGICQFDVVTCNPPYFKYIESSNINKNDYLTLARHEVAIDLDGVIKEASLLLREGGVFSMVHRSERFIDILVTLRKYQLEVKRLRFVYPKKESNESLILLIEAKKSQNQGGLKVLKPLYIYNKNDKYTKEVLNIFNYQEKNHE